MPTILVVDDRDPDRNYLVTLLSYQGHTVIEARNGLEALSILDKQVPDLLITDVLMPSMDGFELVRRIRERDGLAAMPVIFCTATYHEREARALAEQCGVTDVLVKPSEPEVVLAKVHGILSSQLAAAPLHPDFDRRYARLVSEKLLDKVRELEVNEDRTAFALEAARSGEFHINPRTEEIWWSDGAARMFGVPPGRAPLVDGLGAMVHADDLAVIRRQLERAADGASEIAFECRLIGSDGVVRWIEARARLARDLPEASGTLVGVAIDITRRRTLEQQLLQSQKMEVVGRLAGGVAHDFNNLLTVIRGYAELLRDDQRLAPVQPDLEEITLAVDRAASMTRQLLAFSRQQVLQRTPRDMNALVRGVTGMLRRLIGEQLQVDQVLAPQLPPVLVDPGQVEQAIMNLVVNAGDAMPHGGRITVATTLTSLEDGHHIRGAAVARGPYVTLSVTDTGTGIPPDVLGRIFEPFFTTKGRGKGTGLGLATVDSIVAQNHGYLEVETAPGRGSTFRLYFPPTAVDRATDPPEPTRRHGAATGTILLVEDEFAVRDVTERMLERAGYRVLAAASAEEADRMFDAEPEVNLLLTDVVLSQGTGPELFRRLAARQPALKVLFMSGYAYDGMFGTSIPPGADFMQKPFSARQLVGRIGEVLGGT